MNVVADGFPRLPQGRSPSISVDYVIVVGPLDSVVNQSPVPPPHIDRNEEDVDAAAIPSPQLRSDVSGPFRVGCTPIGKRDNPTIRVRAAVGRHHRHRLAHPTPKRSVSVWLQAQHAILQQLLVEDASAVHVLHA